MRPLKTFFSAFAIVLLSMNNYLGVLSTPIASPGEGIGKLNPAAWMAVPSRLS
jgi:hypothetical protein